jgi:hypothetical protein
MFLVLMTIGLAGLGVMAIPALGRHGASLHAKGSAPTGLARTDATHGVARFLPSPRLAFSLLALYGAFGNVLRAAHLSLPAAALIAVVPAGIVERLVMTPVWRLLFRFQAPPSAPLEQLILAEATAVTPFRNGRGIVSLVRDGRLVQFSARLVGAQAATPVKVGDRLRVEDLDAKYERLTVSVLPE